jgi:uncharacterized protein
MPPRERRPQRKAPAGRPLRTAIFLSVVLVVAVAARVATSGGAERSGALDRVLDGVFQDLGVDRARLTAQTVPGDTGPPVSEVDVALPEGGTYARLNAEVSRAVEAAGGTVLEAVETGPSPEEPDGLDIQLGRGHEVTHRLRVRPEPPRDKGTTSDAPRVALVFDDLGYTVNGMAAELLALDAPITFAVLPGLAHSEDFAALAREHGHDVILHLPMEPIDRAAHDPGRDALDPRLPREENLRRLRTQLDGLSSYEGISNHMGSRATAEASLMDLVLGELRRRDPSLYMLDSRTTPYSVVPQRAVFAGVPHAANNIFLDGSDENGVAAGIQARCVASIAKRRGQAIAIGHVRRDTIDAVKGALEGWRRDGIELVPLKDLMHR